ncbi:MAG: VOC family protein [Leptolyngbyaceae cyanobacterium bins.59]|nr:VOC family protein [Leptolyngbyaceae cyanobacterium bins.59]
MCSAPLIRAALVTIATLDFNSLVQFYRQLLQQDPSPWQPDRYAEFSLPGLTLGLFKPKPEHEAEFHQQSHTALSLCFQVADLSATIAHLTHLGYPPVGSVTIAPHGREIYASDPMGNRLILWEPSHPSPP